MLTKSNLVSAFFDNLQDINYVVLRGYDKIPHRITGDIDILINRRDFPRFLQIIESLIQENDLVEMKRIDRGYVRMFRLLKLTQLANFALKIDVHFEENWRGAAYIKAEEILERKIEYDHFFIPSYEDQVCINLFQGLLGMGYLTKKRINQILILLDKVNWSRLDQNNQLILNPESGRNLTQLLNQRSFAKINQLSNIYRSLIWSKSFKTAPLKTTKSSMAFIYKKLKYKISPPGVFIALVGPDGAGKSTAISNVTKFLDQVVINGKSIVIPWRPQYLKRLATLKNDTSLDGLTKTEKAQHIPGKISSFLRFNYYCLDYFLGHYLKNRRILESEGYVLYDRYSYDFLIQPANRSFINLNISIKKLIAFFVPKPDLTIYFSANANILYARKQEETLEELEDLVRRYEKYTSGNKKIVKINAMNDIATVEYDILNSFAKRYAK